MRTDIVKVLSYIQTNLSAENIEQFFANFNADQGATKPLESDRNFTDIEAHKYYELAFQINNSCQLLIAERYYVLEPNQFCLITQDTPHALQWGENEASSADMLWIGIIGRTVRVSYSVYSESGRSKLYGADLHIPAGFLIQEILLERESTSLQARIAVVVYIKALVTMLLKHMRFDDDSVAKAWGSEIVDELRTYIREHVSESVSLQQLSNQVSLSPNYLCKLFKQITGETITNFTQSCKMEMALVYLKDNSLSLSAIASKLGFYDQFHFSKAFKAYMGISPSAYRNKRFSNTGPEE